MQHLDEGTIHAWLDGALPPAEAAEAERHAAECAECAAAVAEARGLIAASSRILQALDRVPGGVLPERRDADSSETGEAKVAAASAAAADGVVPIAAGARRGESRPARRWSAARWAAAAAVAFAAVGTYAVGRDGGVRSMSDAAFENATVGAAAADSSMAATGVATDAIAAEGASAPAPPPAAEPAPQAFSARGARGADSSVVLEAPRRAEAEQDAAQRLAEVRGAAPRAPERREALVLADAAPADSTRASKAAPSPRASVAAPAPPPMPTAPTGGAGSAALARAEAGAPAGVVRGRVTTPTGQPIPGANVFVPGTPRGSATDERGEFVIADAGRGTLQVATRALGYTSERRTIEVRPGDTTTVTFSLTPASVRLDEAVVTTGSAVAQSGAEERARRDGRTLGAAAAAPPIVARVEGCWSIAVAGDSAGRRAAPFAGLPTLLRLERAPAAGEPAGRLTARPLDAAPPRGAWWAPTTAGAIELMWPAAEGPVRLELTEVDGELRGRIARAGFGAALGGVSGPVVARRAECR